MSSASTEPANFTDRHPADADVVKRFFDFFEFEGADDAFQFFHLFTSFSKPAWLSWPSPDPEIEAWNSKLNIVVEMEFVRMRT
jgi:hypothetical protein